MKQRFVGVDLVKCIAIFFVVSVHFFLNTKFYQTPIVGGNMFLQVNMRWLFTTCVPLFLIVTGFLQCKKEFNKKFLLGGLLILTTYIVISLISIWYKIGALGQIYSLKSVMKAILNFSGNGYSWYVEMYFGLFLLIPFINLILSELKIKKVKLSFISILIILCSISELGILPDYWSLLYPILYYSIGAFIREYQPKILKLKCFSVILFLLVIESTITGVYANRYNNYLFGQLFDGYGKLFTLVISVLIFLCIYDIKVEKTRFLKIVKNISESTLEIYLFSYIFDIYFYQKILDKKFISQQQFLKYYFIIVPLVFIFSYCSANIFKFFFEEFLVLLNNTKVKIISMTGEKIERVKKI